MHGGLLYATTAPQWQLLAKYLTMMMKLTAQGLSLPYMFLPIGFLEPLVIDIKRRYPSKTNITKIKTGYTLTLAML